jgi:hypothetical protein
MAFMQDLIKGLGQANSKLAHELEERRRLEDELTDGPPITDNESLVITCGGNAVLSLPESAQWISLPLSGQHESALAVSNGTGSSARSFLVSRLRPEPRLIELGRLLAGYPTERQARLVSVAAEVVCLELARPVLDNAEVKARCRPACSRTRSRRSRSARATS